MRFKIGLFLTVLIGLLALNGCKISSGDDDDDDIGGDVDTDTDTDTDTDGDADVTAGYQWSWTVEDTNAAPVTCEEAGADYTRITVTDSTGVTHAPVYWLCGGGSGQTDAQIPAGDGSFVAALIGDAEDDVLSITDPVAFTFTAGTVNTLNPIEFVVAPYDDPTDEADASLTWEWRYFEGEWTDELDYATDATPFDQAFCDRLKIDYVHLWVWNPVWNHWWTDEQLTRFDCHAYDHPDDNEFWQDEIYSGGFVNDFLEAGTYQFYLGFYAMSEVMDGVDVMLYWDSAGQTGDTLDGTLYTDNVDDPNWWPTIFDNTLIEQLFGVLKINLIWHQEAGTPYENCVQSNVQKMGFLLRSDGWVAAEIPLDDGIECLDWLNFQDVPVLPDAYELLVSAISTDGDFLWYHNCTGLIPEQDVTLDTAVGYTCEIMQD